MTKRLHSFGARIYSIQSNRSSCMMFILNLNTRTTTEIVTMNGKNMDFYKYFKRRLSNSYMYFSFDSLFWLVYVCVWFFFSHLVRSMYSVPFLLSLSLVIYCWLCMNLCWPKGWFSLDRVFFRCSSLVRIALSLLLYLRYFIVVVAVAVAFLCSIYFDRQRIGQWSNRILVWTVVMSAIRKRMKYHN